MKIMYNVTVAIDPQIEQEWVRWMIDVHIPDVLKTGKFLSHSMQKVLGSEEEAGVTYAIQYIAVDMATFQSYQTEDATGLQAAHKAKYEGKYAAFRTLMQVVDESQQ